MRRREPVRLYRSQQVKRRREWRGSSARIACAIRWNPPSQITAGSAARTMRIVTVNVNGIRSAERKGFARWLAPNRTLGCRVPAGGQGARRRRSKSARRAAQVARSVSYCRQAWIQRRGAVLQATIVVAAHRIRERGVRCRRTLCRGRLRTPHRDQRLSALRFELATRQLAKYRFLAEFLPHLLRLRKAGTRSDSVRRSGISHTSRSTSAIGAAIRRTPASYPRSGRGSHVSSMSSASLTSSVA